MERKMDNMDNSASKIYREITPIAQKDIRVLEKKNLTYNDSWKQRGGIGAFMMAARKWDRLENIAETSGYNIFDAELMEDGSDDGMLAQIQDLRRYLFLIEMEIQRLIGYRPGTPEDGGHHDG
jgi:hypothetical protein